jgi:hypothetical protein
MSVWPSDDLARIGVTEELRIAPLRPDGTLRKPVIIWVVRHGDDLYVRSYKGTDAAWFRSAQATHAGRIWAGGVEQDATFVEVDDELNDQVDTAYRNKYRRYAASIIDSITSPVARATTLKLVPR